MKKAFNLFLYSHLYIALCAVVMCFQTLWLYYLPVNKAFLYFVFWGTLCSYNFHSYLTYSTTSNSQKTVWSVRNKKLHLFLFLASFLFAFYFFLQLNTIWLPLLFGAAFTFIYSAPKIQHPFFILLKKIAVAKTVFLALAWTYVTALLPPLLAGGDWNFSLQLFGVNRFFLIYPICILFDYRDRHADQAEGIRSLVTDFEESKIDLLFWSCLAIYFITTFLLHTSGLPLLYSFLLLLPGIALSVIYNSSKKSTADYRFYFVLDGLMMASGLLLLLMSFT